MIAAQQHLAQAGVPTYLMSNISGLHFEDAVRRHPFLSSFTGFILSYQVGRQAGRQAVKAGRRGRQGRWGPSTGQPGG